MIDTQVDFADGGRSPVAGTTAIVPRLATLVEAFDEHLRRRDVDTVVIAGCNFPNCPRATAFDASELDYRTVLVTDALSGTTPDRLDEMERIGVLAATTDDLCRELRRASS